MNAEIEWVLCVSSPWWRIPHRSVLTVCMENSFWTRAQIPCKCSLLNTHKCFLPPSCPLWDLTAGAADPSPLPLGSPATPETHLLSVLTYTHPIWCAGQLCPRGDISGSVADILLTCKSGKKPSNSPPLDNVHRVFLNTPITAQTLKSSIQYPKVIFYVSPKTLNHDWNTIHKMFTKESNALDEVWSLIGVGSEDINL